MQTFSKFPVNLTVLETTSPQKPGSSFGLSNSSVNLLWASQISCQTAIKWTRLSQWSSKTSWKSWIYICSLSWSLYMEGKKKIWKTTRDLTATTKWQEDNAQLKKSSVLWEGSVIIVEQQNLLLAPTIPCSKKHFFSFPLLSKIQPIKSIRCQQGLKKNPVIQ